MVAIERYNAPQKIPAEGLRPPSTHKQRLGKLIDLVGTIGLGSAENPLGAHPRPRLRRLPHGVRECRREGRRAIRHAALHGPLASQDGRAVQGASR